MNAHLGNHTAWAARPAVIALVAVVSMPVGAGAALAQDSAEPLAQALRWRNIGNANQRGRISSIDALDDDFAHVVVGTASGGVYKSTNAGTSWTAIFDNYGAASIGDVKLFQPDPNIIWVGTGEECGRNSAAWGKGRIILEFYVETATGFSV